ncbi:MAG: hypothetical protein WBB67_04070 [bacterium]
MQKNALFLIVLCLSCIHYSKYVPEPEADIEKWVNNFAQQRSFSYHYELQTQAVYTTAQGECIIGRVEHNKGQWRSADIALDFEYCGMGDIQYGKADNEWELSTRGEESDILTQIERVLEFDKFEYIGIEQGYLYNFKANIPFLAPGRWKEITGWLKISQGNYLPEEIWTGLPDSSVYWKIELADFNKKKSIKPPVHEWHSYALGLSIEYAEPVKRRIDLLDIDCRLAKTEEEIILVVPKQYNVEDIREILSSRRLTAYRVVKNKGLAQKVAYLNNQKAVPIYLADRLFDRENIKGAKIKFDGASEPYIEISLHEKIMSVQQIAFEIDNILVSTLTLDTEEKIGKINLYTDMPYYEMQILIGGLLEYLPPVEVREVFEE